MLRTFFTATAGPLQQSARALIIRYWRVTRDRSYCVSEAIADVLVHSLLDGLVLPVRLVITLAAVLFVEMTDEFRRRALDESVCYNVLWVDIPLDAFWPDHNIQNG